MRLVGDYLIPGAGDGAVVAGGAIDIDDAGRILGVGTESELGEAAGEVHRVGGLLMPGLVNAHAHGPMTLLRSAGDGMALMPWLTEAVWPREAKMTAEHAEIGATLAMCEQLLAGVTTSTEMYLFERALVAAAENTGARAQIMAGLISVVVPDEAALEARLDAIEQVRMLHHDPDSRITVGYGAHSVYDLGPDRLTRIAERAAENDIIVHVHLEETEAERNDVIAAHGRTATQLLADTGALAGRVVAAHGVWLGDEDMELLANAGASVIHCPQSNLKLGSGFARISALRHAGVRVGLGTDGAASNDNLNLWEDMRLAVLLARGAANDPGALTAVDAFALATRDGAVAGGIGDVGELRTGAWADVVRLDLDHPEFATGIEADLFNNLVWAGGRHHVTDVWVAGQRVVAGGEMTTVDAPEIYAQARTAAHELLT